MYRIVRSISKMKLIFPKKLPVKHFRSSIFNRYLSHHNPKNVYLVDEDESFKSDSIRTLNKYTKRTHTCGELRINNVGEQVILCGWLEFQRLNKFIVLRDSYGETQLIISDKDVEMQKQIQSLSLETIIQVNGTVLARPEKMKNKKQPTGDIEVVVQDLIILNYCKEKLPFNIREFQKAKEALRMQYRYLDLRFPFMQRNLRVRSEMIMKMREFLINCGGFVDVETPTLFKATPGGAQEFVVPTRSPGQFYSLVQSPQQFKQMLMAGAIDKYFQIARCYRDEGSRSDRQPEFTQLDIEMSFTDLDSILQLVEDLLCYSWPEFLSPILKKFPRVTFNDALEHYGSDQPDIRFEFKLQNCTDLFKANEKLISDPDFGAYCITFPKEFANLGKGIKEKLITLSKNFPLTKFVQTKVTNSCDVEKKIGKLLSEKTAAKLGNWLNLQDETVLFLAYGNKNQTQTLLGKIRVEYADYLEEMGVSVRKKGMHLLWVVDTPLFEASLESGKLSSMHHPFTSPNMEDIHLLETSPLQVRSLSFDLVLNGNEIGGGSVRIHDPILQKKIFEMLNIDKSSMQHIIDMLSSGCPPHGGIALGLDRLMSKILNTVSIRDVIAFPKTFEGRDLISGAPSAISESDKKLYNIKSVYPTK